MSCPMPMPPANLLQRRRPLALASLAVLVAASSAAQEVGKTGQTVVVTATRYALAEVDAPASMSVVTRQDIEARGADNLLEALRGQPGISVQGRSIGGRKVLSIRGLDSKHTLFLVDGRRVGASDGLIGHSDFQYDWIPVADIERIEVVRGPMSVLYGSEAMGGVVNVITREPGEAWHLDAMVEGSQAAGDRGGDGNRLSLVASGPVGANVYLRAGAAATWVDPLASPADPRISELEGRERRDGWLGLGWRGAPGQRVDFEHREGREERQADARERGGRRRYHQTFNDIERSLTSLAWDDEWRTPLAPAPLASQLRVYRSSIDIENRRTEGVAVNPPQRIEEQVFDGQARLPLAGHGLTAGFELRNESLADPGLPGGQSVARHRSLFAQDEVALAPALTLTAGLRYDRDQLYGDEWSPRVYLVWRADSQWTVKGGYGHGFKAPNLKQTVPGARAEGPNLFFGNPNLVPETSDGVELGLAWSAGGTQLQMTAFAQRVDNLIEVRLLSPGTVPGTGSYTYENLAEGRFSGIEAGWTQAFGHGFSTELTYTYLDARNGDGQRLDKRPRHSAMARLDWQRDAWRASLYADRTADQLLPTAIAGAPPQPVPDVTLVGAFVARTLPAGLELSLGVQNLTDVRLSEKSALFTQVEPPRTVRLTLRGRW